MLTRILPHLWMLLICVSIQAEVPSTELLFSPDAIDLTPAAGSTADKARLLRLKDGTLVVAWHEGVEMTHEAWGLDGVLFAPRDIFIVASSDGGVSWGDPINVSNTATLTDASVLYDRNGDGSGLANFPGDSGKATIFASGKNLVITWNDTYCGSGSHGPARYKGPLGEIEVPYRCLYAARATVSAGNISLISVDRLTDGTRDVKNELARGTGAGFALAWQEDPAGLQLGEARGEGHGASGAKVSRGTDVWYAWIKGSEFADHGKSWHGPVPISNNFDYENDAVSGGGASRPVMAMAGSPPSAVIVYEERKNSGGVDVGKYVRFHQFPFNAPQASAPGVIISAPGENGRRARVVATSTPGKAHGTRMVLMWRQGEGIQGAPADFMVRVGSVPPGADLESVPNAGFRVEDLWPPVDPEDPFNSEPGLNISGAELNDPTSVDPATNSKAHRAVLAGDFIYAGYVQDANVMSNASQFQYFLRWSKDGGKSWSIPTKASAGMAESANIIEPRLIRTPGSVDSGLPEDVRNPTIFVTAWGTEIMPEDSLEPIRDGLFVTRTVDSGVSFERVQAFDASKTASNQTDEQIQLRVTPHGQNVFAVWIRKDTDESNVMFNSAVGITPTADLSVSMEVSENRPDVGETVEVTARIVNIGPHAATELQLALNLPAGLALTSVVPSSGSCETLADMLCEFDKLAPGSAATLELSFIAETRGGWLLAATVSAWEIDPEPAYDSTDVVIEAIPHADIAVTLAARDLIAGVGETIEMDYEIFNSGPQIAKGVVVTFEVPLHVAVSVPSRCKQDGALLTCEMPDLLMADAWRDTLVLHAMSAGNEPMTAAVASEENDPEPDNNAVSTGVFVMEQAQAVATGGGGSGLALTLLLLGGLLLRVGSAATGRLLRGPGRRYDPYFA